jgi:hypothetical protein
MDVAATVRPRNGLSLRKLNRRRMGRVKSGNFRTITRTRARPETGN